MGLRDSVRKRVRRVINQFSGEYSAPAPEELKPYEVPGTPQDDAEVVMARLYRPGEAKKPAGRNARKIVHEDGDEDSGE